jgi:hypothetical protein
LLAACSALSAAISALLAALSARSASRSDLAASDDALSAEASAFFAAVMASSSNVLSSGANVYRVVHPTIRIVSTKRITGNNLITPPLQIFLYLLKVPIYPYRYKYTIFSCFATIFRVGLFWQSPISERQQAMYNII